VVLHTFDLETGLLVGTKKYADPIKEGEHHASR
jgi:hypothetical protein